ncbi:uncharacterized protein ASPGLDRAFT_1502670 [Aspergillus glaucus CBS 516.65]|uniref:Uncharacterized protein n=1 Tax=Aspergillus glaucus CBS 516.65 TaxID=1160497 RepID=A0A1L9V986_ASPGL|nr:hypothetical protein ASPGLDRAFT_1502670 [Aspergillus glaucus CBS 516.65]OJJ80449.1 hypothetical protein ASPGLDRAFT_1502670 [Aspergillus glaucus CBS 516.65]
MASFADKGAEALRRHTAVGSRFWPLPTEPGQRPLQHRSRDGLPGSSASNPDRVDQPTGQRNWQLDPSAAVAPKHLASCYFQLKKAHSCDGSTPHQQLNAASTTDTDKRHKYARQDIGDVKKTPIKPLLPLDRLPLLFFPHIRYSHR